MVDVAMDLSAREVQTSLLFSSASLQVQTLLCGCQLRTMRGIPWRRLAASCQFAAICSPILRDPVVTHVQMNAMMQQEWCGIAFFDEVDIAPSQFIDASGDFL